MKEAEIEFYDKTLKNLGLCEKMGINGQVMLYPIKTQEKKWHQTEYLSMVDRLYKTKPVKEYRHVSYFDSSVVLVCKFNLKKTRSGNLKLSNSKTSHC